MDEPHFPRPAPPPSSKAVVPAPSVEAAGAARAAVVVRRPDAPVDPEPKKAGLTPEEVRALLQTTEVNAPRSGWSRSARRATGFLVLAAAGWVLDGLLGFWPSTAITTVLGIALFVWTIRPLWGQRDWH